MSESRRSEPLTLFLDREVEPPAAFLVDDLNPEKPAKENFPPRREYFQFAQRSPEERLEFWHDGWGAGDPPLEEFLYDIPPVSQWTAEQRAELDTYEQAQSRWLDEEVEIWEMQPRDLAIMTRFGPGIELFEALGPKEAMRLGLYEDYFGGPASDGYRIAFGGDVGRLNATLTALGINVVVRDAPNDEEDWDDA